MAQIQRTGVDDAADGGGFANSAIITARELLPERFRHFRTLVLLRLRPV